jgi:hypothetical protein
MAILLPALVFLMVLLAGILTVGLSAFAVVLW